MGSDGGQAFPSAGDPSQVHIFAEKGMSLRDYFAAAALTGILAEEGRASQVIQPVTYGESEASSAYRYADAMLAERERHDES